MDKTLRKALLLLFFACFLYILSFFHRVCPAVISLDLGRELGLDTESLTLFSSATMLAYGLMQLPSGLLADALGGRKAVVLLTLLAGGAVVVFGLLNSFPVMIGVRFAIGIGLAITVPCMVLLAAWFPPASFGRASSVLLGCGGLGGILAAPPLAFLSSHFGWRTPIIGAGILTLALAVLIWIFVRDTPTPEAVPRRKASPSALARGIGEVLRTRAFWPVALWSMCSLGGYFAMISLLWGPYLMQGCGLSKEAASLVLTVGSLLALTAQPLTGWLSDTLLKSRRKPLLFGTCCGLLTALGMVFCANPSGVAVYVIMIGFTLGTCATGPMAFSMLREIFPLRLVGTASGCMNMLQPLWSIVVQKLFALVLALAALESGTSGPAFACASWVLVGNFVIALVMCLLMKETFGQDPERNGARS